MHQDRALAYSLRQAEDGWRWCVYDEDGLTVANGADVSQAGAQAAVHTMLLREGADMGVAA